MPANVRVERLMARRVGASRFDAALAQKLCQVVDVSA
jgi:hypothetical protein